MKFWFLSVTQSLVICYSSHRWLRPWRTSTHFRWAEEGYEKPRVRTKQILFSLPVLIWTSLEHGCHHNRNLRVYFHHFLWLSVDFTDPTGGGSPWTLHLQSNVKIMSGEEVSGPRFYPVRGVLTLTCMWSKGCCPRTILDVEGIEHTCKKQVLSTMHTSSMGINWLNTYGLEKLCALQINKIYF